MISMFLSQEHKWNYERDGYVLLTDVFSPLEVKLMIRAVESGERVAQTTHGSADASGKKARLALWHELGDDIWAAASTSPRIVNAVRILLGEEAAFFHGKVMLKEARSGGAWEWHQDYGYWYDQGFLFPRLISAFAALDTATIENGCLQVLRGSHHLGRLDHGRVGQQTGADAHRMELIESTLDRVYVEMKPGSVLFFHSNLLHSSAPNNSPHHRRSFIMCYNALANPQLGERKTSEQRPVPVGADECILQFA
ncbi:MAG: hypothetical protein JWN98_1364 [Abditibacteriota bacterium]|nr:hypothetical protein [Abditibacteriota bacterium]